MTDTGIGMSEMSMANIFQPFVQADGTMTRKYGGTGLGLFLSRKLARLLGGDVILRRSEPDRGSEFQILINIEVDSVKITPSPENMKLLSPPSVNDQSSPIKILLVDDSADNRTLISAFLSRPGIHLDTAENGVVGVDKALHNTYDLVLMDIQMPEMDGYEAIRVLNQKGYRGPVVALTAHAMKGDRERCLRAGFDDYLCKPVNRQSLMNLLPRYGTTPPASAPVLH